jgi:hypothetical protein
LAPDRRHQIEAIQVVQPVALDEQLGEPLSSSAVWASPRGGTVHGLSPAGCPGTFQILRHRREAAAL